MALDISKAAVDGLLFGNRCGHSPKNPKLYQRPEKHKYRYTAIEYAVEALKRAYTEPSKLMGKLLCHVNRIKRSERREAIIAVSQLFLNYTDSRTLFVRVPTENGHQLYLDLKWISKKLSMSIIRVRRAIMCMVRAGYLEVKRSFNTASIKRICAQFFIDLGVKQEKLFEMKAFKDKKEELSFVSELRTQQAIPAGSRPVLSDILKGLSTSKMISKDKPKPVLNQSIIANAQKIEDLTKNPKLQLRNGLPDYEQKQILEKAIERYHDNKNRSLSDHTEDLYQEYFAKRGVAY